jgi:hypothetical protein
MQLDGTSNLTLALIYRDRYGGRTADTLNALRHLGASQLALAVRHRWVPPDQHVNPRTRLFDRIEPADWPYADPLDQPPKDQPYQPHVIPPKEIHHESPNPYPGPADIKGRWIDVYA